MKARQILIVMPQANLGGGAEVMLLNFLLGARVFRPNWTFSVFFLRGGPFVARLLEDGFSVCHVAAVHLRRPASCLQALVQLIHTVRRTEPSAIISWVAYGQLFGGLAAWWSGIPALWYQIGTASGLLDRLASRIPAARILAVSSFIAVRQRDLAPKCPVLPVLPGIDTNRFANPSTADRDRLRQSLGLPTGSPIAVMVGRLQRWKGFHTAIDAMPLVLARVPEAKLVIVGGMDPSEPTYFDDLKNQTRTLRCQESIIFAGMQNNVGDWMGAAEVVVHASSEEPFGIVAIEAMACGRPVICGDRGGVIEAVRDQIDGFHVAYEDTAGLAYSITRLFQDPALRREMGESAFQRGKQFSQSRYAEEICQAIESTINVH